MSRSGSSDKSTDAHLVHRFAKVGNYLLRVEAFAGQGGPDYSYQLKIAPGEPPQETSTEHAGAGRNGAGPDDWTQTA